MKIIFLSIIITLSCLYPSEEYDKLIEKLQLAKIDKETIWYSKYNSYITYQSIEQTLKSLKKKIRSAKKRRKYKQLSILEQEKALKLSELKLLVEYKNSTFGNLLRSKTIKKQPTITNPIGVIPAMSFMQTLENTKDTFDDNLESLNLNISQIIDKVDILSNIIDLSSSEDINKTTLLDYKNNLEITILELENFRNAKTNYQTTLEIYSQRANDVIVDLSHQIKSQVIKLAYILTIIIVLIIISSFIKIAFRKYMDNYDRLYTVNKSVNIVNIIIIITIILFSYLENVTYMATILGFASAGIAIAMRDWFMSILGWMVIMIGGSIHVGDRIRFAKNNQIYLGDVLDISMLRITLHEGITYTTYTTNRRAGRIIFVPNNFIFSSMIANYSHGGMKTVWDGLDITITFDSNHEKAVFIAKEVAMSLSKGYTSIARKQLNLLRSKYNLRNTQVEPQCFSLLESYGMRISIWYQTNSYATLTLRSTLSATILDRYQKESDIQIAYKTQDINFSQKDKVIEVENNA